MIVQKVDAAGRVHCNARLGVEWFLAVVLKTKEFADGVQSVIAIDPIRRHLATNLLG